MNNSKLKICIADTDTKMVKLTDSISKCTFVSEQKQVANLLLKALAKMCKQDPSLIEEAAAMLCDLKQQCCA